MYEVSTQHYVAAQAHEAYAQFIEAAIQGNVVKETDIAYDKCMEEDRKAFDNERQPSYLNVGLAHTYKKARPLLVKEYNSYQKNLHLLLVHVHRALAMEHATSMISGMHGMHTSPARSAS
jgi:hypothetical protein